MVEGLGFAGGMGVLEVLEEVVFVFREELALLKTVFALLTVALGDWENREGDEEETVNEGMEEVCVGEASDRVFCGFTKATEPGEDVFKG